MNDFMMGLTAGTFLGFTIANFMWIYVIKVEWPDEKKEKKNGLER